MISVCSDVGSQDRDRNAIWRILPSASDPIRLKRGREEDMQLSKADHQRLNQLHREAGERLHQAATIAAKALGYGDKVSGIGFVKKGQPNAPRPDYFAWPVGHRVYIVTDNGCGYYDYDTGECVSTPCAP